MKLAADEAAAEKAATAVKVAAAAVLKAETEKAAAVKETADILAEELAFKNQMMAVTEAAETEEAQKEKFSTALYDMESNDISYLLNMDDEEIDIEMENLLNKKNVAAIQASILKTAEEEAKVISESSPIMTMKEMC